MRFLISINRKLQKLLLFGLFKDCAKASPQMPLHSRYMQIWIENYLLLVLEASPLVRSSESTCIPSRHTDRSPTTSAGSLSPTRCNVTTTCSTGKQTEQRSLSYSVRKKGLLFKKPIADLSDQRGKKTQIPPRTTALPLHYFFCVAKLSIFIYHQEVIASKKGQNRSTVLLLPGKDYYHSRD